MINEYNKIYYNDPNSFFPINSRKNRLIVVKRIRSNTERVDML